MGVKRTISKLYDSYKKEILQPSKEYNQYKSRYFKCRDKLEYRLNEVNQELLENICNSIFDLEQILHKQAFVEGFCLGTKLFAEGVEVNIIEN